MHKLNGLLFCLWLGALAAFLPWRMGQWEYWIVFLLPAVWFAGCLGRGAAALEYEEEERKEAEQTR